MEYSWTAGWILFSITLHISVIWRIGRQGLPSDNMLILPVVTALPTKLFKIISDLNLALGPNTVAGLNISILKLSSIKSLIIFSAKSFVLA